MSNFIQRTAARSLAVMPSSGCPRLVLSFGLPAISFSPWTMSSTRFKRMMGTAVGLITLPPGLLLQAIKTGGWIYGDTAYRGLPDVYASVNLGHLKQLKAAGTMESYMVYMHNELQIMVAKNNPKKIAGIKDLVREDVRTSMPSNPINEGIHAVLYPQSVGTPRPLAGDFRRQRNACLVRRRRTTGLPPFITAKRPIGSRRVKRMPALFGRPRCWRLVVPVPISTPLSSRMKIVCAAKWHM